jgi:hypothetical protein
MGFVGERPAARCPPVQRARPTCAPTSYFPSTSSSSISLTATNWGNQHILLNAIAQLRGMIRTVFTYLHVLMPSRQPAMSVWV